MKLVREHINEKFEETSDPIKDMGVTDTYEILVDHMTYYAEKNGYTFGIKKDVPHIIVPINYDIMMSYDQLKWPAHVTQIKYTVTSLSKWSTAKIRQKYSLRKISYGYEPDPADYWDGPWNKVFKELLTKKDVEAYNQMKFDKLHKDIKDNKIKIKNLKQTLIGKFNTPLIIIDKIDLNIKNELKKVAKLNK